MPDWIVAAVLGIIEGITEFLPISSTGHLLIAEHVRWLPRQSDLFNVVIQCGAVIAVLPLFPERLRAFLFRWREPATRDYLLKVVGAFVLTGAGGLIIDKLFKLPEELKPVAWALVAGGALFVGIEYWTRGKPQRAEVTWTIALAVGLAQLAAAVFPGTSRSGATILIALVLGLNRPAATEFSFLVGIPTMLAAGGLKIFKALHHPHSAAAGAGATTAVPQPEHWGMLAVATLVAGVVSFAAVKWLLRYVQTHTFTPFGWYRIALGALILAFFH